MTAAVPAAAPRPQPRENPNSASSSPPNSIKTLPISQHWSPGGCFCSPEKGYFFICHCISGWELERKLFLVRWWVVLC